MVDPCFPEKQQHDRRYVYLCTSYWKLYACIRITLHWCIYVMFLRFRWNWFQFLLTFLWLFSFFLTEEICCCNISLQKQLTFLFDCPYYVTSCMSLNLTWDLVCMWRTSVNYNSHVTCQFIVHLSVHLAWLRVWVSIVRYLLVWMVCSELVPNKPLHDIKLSTSIFLTSWPSKSYDSFHKPCRCAAFNVAKWLTTKIM